MKPIDINALSADQKRELLKELEQQQANEINRLKEERQAYKDLVNEQIPKLFMRLQAANRSLLDAKIQVFKGVETLVKMKAEVYGRDDDQFTHSFTTDCGITLMLGYRTTDSWDDTITAGLCKIDNYIKSLIKDDNSAFLVGFITDLLTRDRKGNLNAKNVLKLRKKANETGDAEFIDGVNIVLDAYRPIKGKSFITATYRNENGDKVELALDITDIDLPQDNELVADQN